MSMHTSSILRSSPSDAGGRMPAAPKMGRRAQSGGDSGPTRLAGRDAASRTLTLALFLSVLLHGVVLSIKFRLPEMLLAKVRDSQLEIILVNSKSARRPADPQARAQTNLDGGGNTEQERLASTPLPPTTALDDGRDLIQAQRKAQQLEVQQRPLMTQPQDPQAVAIDATQIVEQPKPTTPMAGAELAQQALVMARLEAKIARQVELYNKRLRKTRVGSSTTEAVEAQYVEDWRQKVERVGNYNYPQSAKGRIYGNLTMTVSIRADGSVDSIVINRSSGHQVLDDGARNIVELAAPFAPFPPKLSQDTDILEITRTWTFTRADQLQSE